MTAKVRLALTAIVCLSIGGTAGYFGANALPSGGRTPPGQFQGRTGGGQRFQNGQQPSGNAARFGGGNRISGKVVSVLDGRMTIQTPDENSQIILINDSTTYQQTVAGSAGEVTENKQIMVSGQKNPDGSTTAESIQIMPDGSGFPFGPRPGS